MCTAVELRLEEHDERKYESIDALKAGIASDTRAAREWWARQPT